MPKTLSMESICNIMCLTYALAMDHSMGDLQVGEFSKSHQVIVYDLKGPGKA